MSDDRSRELAASPPAFRRDWTAGLFTLIVGPPLGFLLLLVLSGFGPLHERLGLAIIGIPFTYLAYGLPAFVAGWLFGEWSRHVALAWSLSGAAIIGVVTTGAYAFVLSSVGAGPAFGLDGIGLIGASVGVFCATLLEARWRLPPAASAGGLRKKAAAAIRSQATIPLGVLLFAALTVWAVLSRR